MISFASTYLQLNFISSLTPSTPIKSTKVLYDVTRASCSRPCITRRISKEKEEREEEKEEEREEKEEKEKDKEEKKEEKEEIEEKKEKK